MNGSGSMKTYEMKVRWEIEATLRGEAENVEDFLKKANEAGYCDVFDDCVVDDSWRALPETLVESESYGK
jgi:hypothetical protein